MVPDNVGNALYFKTSDFCICRWADTEGFSQIVCDDSALFSPQYRHEQYWFTSKDGRSIPVHRLIPPNPKNLAIVFVFGGPRSHIDLKDPVLIRLVSEGYEVLCPVYRGCKGYGDEHEDAHIGEYGRSDVWDVVACAEDWRRRFGHARPIAVVGFSYGGFLTYLSMAITDAPWTCGISLWGATSIMGLHVPRSYPDDPVKNQMAQFERSPIQQASCIRMPLLILHGSHDTTSTDEDVGLIQKGVQSSGTACKLVIYYDDTHGLKKHRREMFQEILRFLEENGEQKG